MTLSGFEWGIIGALAGLALGVIGYFLKRTMNNVDEHDKDIATIKQTYSTKEEVGQIKDELRTETKKLQTDIEEIKANYLTKDDFYRAQQNSERRLEKIYDLLVEIRGPRTLGKE